MCGIFSIICSSSTRNILLRDLVKGIKHLEYRGYDSCGVAYFQSNETINILKTVGGYEQMEGEVMRLVEGTEDHIALVGIAHTRWATHGVVVERNTHPHTCGEMNEFVVVHNGIVNNWEELKSILVNDGYCFYSDTDTEVVAKLAHYYYKSNKSLSFKDIIAKVMEKIQGSSAMIFMSSLFPNEVCLAKNDSSPLIIGSCEQEGKYVIASDIFAISPHTNRVMTIDDGDIIHINAKGELENINFKKYESIKEWKIMVNMVKDGLEKREYDSVMYKEICEQVCTVYGTIDNRINFISQTVNLPEIDPYIERIKNGRRFIFLGCGTSYHSAMAMRDLIEEFSLVPTTVDIATEFYERKPLINSQDICFLISQSGETADTIEALKYCKNRGALCIGITNVPHSEIAKKSDCNIHIGAGTEIGVASTKAYTSQLLTLIMIALRVSANETDESKLKKNRIIHEIGKLNKYITHILSREKRIITIAQKLISQNTSRMLIIGRGFHYATSKEGALKIKEISYIHCEGIYSGELKHGSLALIDKDMPVILICTKDNLEEKNKNVYEQIIAREGVPIVICNVGEKRYKKVNSLIKVPETEPCLQTILNVIPLQLLAFHLATQKGLNVDKPRHLAKSVTVSD